MINRLNIISGYKDGRSYLKDAFFTRPFRLANIGEDKTDPALYLMVQNSSPGILDKDHYAINIQMESKSKLLLDSQSYQRLFNMKEGAKQDMNVSLSEYSAFSYVQHPIVPHELSIFRAHNVIRMEDNCSLTLGEIITCGRKHSGEEFKYSRFQNLTEIYLKNKLILKDNVLLQPQLTDVHTLGQMEGYTHQGTLIYINTGLQEIKPVIENALADLISEEDIAFGVSQPFQDCMIVRVLGNGGEQMFNAFRRIQKEIWALENQASVVLNTAEESFAV